MEKKMIHIKAIDGIANKLIYATGYDEELIHKKNSGKKSADIKCWLTALCLQSGFTHNEVNDYMNLSCCSKQMTRHMKRLKDKDYRMKWEIINQAIF